MIFCGRTFCSARNTLNYTSTNIPDIKVVRLQNGIFDDLYITKNVSSEYTNIIPKEWDFDTILYAKFENNLLAGNVNFAISQVDSVLIKRKVENTGSWMTLFEITIQDIEDFNFARLDKYVRANVKYEYALVPMLNGSEGELNINSILSEFEGIFIMEKDITYGSIIDISMTSSKNRPTAVINTIGSKYPYVISNGNNNYYSGTTSAKFIRTDTNTYNWDYYNSWKYREDVMDFLCNGKPKLLKHFDGRMYIVVIEGNPSQSEESSNYVPQTTFNWYETGDAESTQDLYDNNLIDYNNRYKDVITGGEA